MDRDDLDEAIEQAAFRGDVGRRSGLVPRTQATDREVDQLRDQLRRLLEELPGGVTIAELRELLEPDAGEPDAGDPT